MTRSKQSLDPFRNRARYTLLVQALTQASREIRLLEQSDDWRFEMVVTRCLPYLADALDAEHTFLARVVAGEQGRRWLELVSTYPNVHYGGQRIELIGRLHALIQQGRTRVIAPLGESNPGLLGELALFDATSAILVSLQSNEVVYVVGVCNRRDATFGPFVAADRKVFDHILDLVRSALHTGERRRLELESIQRISERVTSSDLQDVYQQIVHEAVTVTQTLYAAIWQVNKNKARLDFVAAQHASESTWQPREPSLLLDPWSLNGFVALSQAARYVTDVASEVHYQPWDATTTAAFCVPLVYRDHVLGTLYVASAATAGISAEDRRFISQLAPHAAIAMHNARMHHIHQLVIAFQQRTANILPLTEELEQIYQELTKYMDTSGLVIARIDESGRLTFPLVYNRGRRVEEVEKERGLRYGLQPLGHARGMVEWVVKEHKTLLVRDFDTDPVAAEIDERTRPGVVSCVVLPIYSAGRIIGAIGLRSYDLALRFDEYDVYFLEGLASYLAVVIENSDWFDRTVAQLHQRVEELQAVSQFQQAISTLAKSEGQEIHNIHRHATDALRAVAIDTSNMLIVRYHKGRTGEPGWLDFPLVYERGRLLSDPEKEADPAYRPRRLGERHDIIDWVIQHRSGLLGRTRSEIEGWVGNIEGVAVAPQRSRSWLGAPMIAGGELLGLIALRDFDREHAFHERHQELARTIASQAATAIQNARLFENVERQVKELNALYKELNALYAAGQTIAAAGLDRDRVLQTILEQAVNVTGAHFGTLQLRKGDHLEFVAAWPLSERERLQEKYGRMSIYRKAITARVARTNHYYLATDVTQEEEYEEGSDETRSELAVSLRRGGEEDGPCEGVLNVEHKSVGGLGQQHVQPLISLSNLAVVAIQNANRARQLTRSNAVAAMGAWGAELQHDANTVVNHLRLAVAVLRDLPGLPPAAHEQIEMIDQFAAEMGLPGLPEQPPEPGKPVELRSAPAVDETLRAQLAIYRQQRPRIAFVEELNATGVHVAIHEPWLRRIVRHFLNNAAKFIPESQPYPRITVATRIEGSLAAIYVTDNGKGVRMNIRDQLFLQPIDHEERRFPDRRGYGLWLIGYVIERYGGHCELVKSEPGQGSTFVIRLPIAQDGVGES